VRELCVFKLRGLIPMVCLLAAAGPGGAQTRLTIDPAASMIVVTRTLASGQLPTPAPVSGWLNATLPTPASPSLGIDDLVITLAGVTGTMVLGTTGQAAVSISGLQLGRAAGQSVASPASPEADPGAWTATSMTLGVSPGGMTTHQSAAQGCAILLSSGVDCEGAANLALTGPQNLTITSARVRPGSTGDERVLELDVNALLPARATQPAWGTVRVAGRIIARGTASAPPTCRADFNGDTRVTIDDIFIYLNAWFAADPRADLGGDGLNIDDIFVFLNLWFAGCAGP
jgi:hypothetical protein